MTEVSAQDSFAQSAGPMTVPVQMRITNLADFLHLGNGDSTRGKQLNALNHLIHSQADMHESLYHGNPNTLGRAIKDRASTFRGFIVHSEEGRPAAYCVYYPMVDAEGKRAAYCEDIFIVEAFRGYGIFSSVLKELARLTVSENLEYVQWSTDARNNDFLAASKSKGIVRAPIHKWDCMGLMDHGRCNSVAQKAHIDTSEYIARPLNKDDIYRVASLGHSKDLITNTGDLDFRGFIVFHKDDRNAPVAIVPGWKRLSTFRLVEDIVLEQPRIRQGHEALPIVLAVADAARKAGKANLLWHIIDGQNTELEDVLSQEFGAHPETMSGTPESMMITHILRNGNLRALAEAKPNLLIQKPVNAPIGARVGRAPASTPDSVQTRTIKPANGQQPHGKGFMSPPLAETVKPARP